MQYVDYDFYADEYGGTLVEEDEFKRYENVARMYVDNQTANKSKVAINDEEKGPIIKIVICMLIDVDKELDSAKRAADETLGSSNIKSETVGTVSREYDTDKRSSVQLLRDAERIAFYKRKSIIVDYLWQTGLLYNGVEIV